MLRLRLRLQLHRLAGLTLCSGCQRRLLSKIQRSHDPGNLPSLAEFTPGA